MFNEPKVVVAPPLSTDPDPQLALDLTQRSALFSDTPKVELSPSTPLRPADEDDLEIIVNTTPPPSTPDEATGYKAPTAIIQEDTPDLSEPYDPTLELSHDMPRIPTPSIVGRTRQLRT